MKTIEKLQKIVDLNEKIENLKTEIVTQLREMNLYVGGVAHCFESARDQLAEIGGKLVFNDPELLTNKNQ